MAWDRPTRLNSDKCYGVVIVSWSDSTWIPTGAGRGEMDLTEGLSYGGKRRKGKRYIPTGKVLVDKETEVFVTDPLELLLLIGV